MNVSVLPEFCERLKNSTDEEARFLRAALLDALKRDAEGEPYKGMIAFAVLCARDRILNASREELARLLADVARHWGA